MPNASRLMHCSMKMGFTPDNVTALAHWCKAPQRAANKLKSQMARQTIAVLSTSPAGNWLTYRSAHRPTDTATAKLDHLLLAITGATIGKIGIVKRYERLAFSGDLLCLRSAERIDPHYLLLVLDHRLGQVQFLRWITGFYEWASGAA